MVWPPVFSPMIEAYLDRPRTEALLAQIDAIFFEASGTKSFPSAAARDAFRERWLGRYLKHDPQHALLALQSPGTASEVVAGYLVGAIDDPARAPRFQDLGYFQNLHHLTARYPAQLHVNLAPGWRSVGIGRKLLEEFCANASALGAPGVHVFTGRGLRNVHFYARAGFEEVGSVTWNARELVMLGRRLTA